MNTNENNANLQDYKLEERKPLSTINTMQISQDFKSKEQSLVIEKKDISNLNDRIKEDVSKNETERQRGLVSLENLYVK